ncbi:MAG: trypsin-like serine protease [Mediterranea massiliensis]|nr:trypsin-like serine protease [Mediterranea massiliensis]
MKQTTKNILGIVAIVLLSSGVAGFTTYKMLSSEQPVEKSAIGFDEVFQINDSNLQLASYPGVPSQPIDLTKAAESSVNAVVHIRSTQASKVREVEVRDPFYDFFGDFFGQRGQGGTQKRQVQTPERRGYGSGVIISKDGYIVTNNHVVEGADEITVKLNDDRELQGRMIGTDPSTDLALIKIEGNDFPAIPVGDSDALKIGEWVLAVGNPFNLNSTVTAGIVSAKARAIGSESANGQAATIQSFIQTDAAINAGNSGGALVNARGELVGINAMLYSPTGAYSGYGFAIPTTIMKKVVADLKEFGVVQRALLGISCLDLSTDLQMDEKQREEVKKKLEELGVSDGVMVGEVMAGGSSEGLLKENDVIIGLGNKRVHRFSDLQEALQQYRPGDKVEVKIVRNKKQQTVTVELKNEQGTTKTMKNVDMEILGAAFRPLSDDLKNQLKLSYGLQVSGLTEGKMADAGVRGGFIILKANGQLIKSEDDLLRVFKAAVKSPDQVLFLSGVFPSGKRGNYAVDLSQE